MDLEDMGDRAGVVPSRPEPEQEWTDRAALARAVAQSRTREEAIALIAAWDPPEATRRGSRAERGGAHGLVTSLPAPAAGRSVGRTTAGARGDSALDRSPAREGLSADVCPLEDVRGA